MGRLGLGFFFAKTSILLTLLALAWHTRNHLFADHPAGVSTQSLAGLDPLGSTLSDDPEQPNLLAIDKKKYTSMGRSLEDPKSYWETEVSSGDQLQHLIDNPNLLGDQRQYGFSLPKLSEPRGETVARGTSSDGTSPATMSETLAPSTVDPVFTFEHVSAGLSRAKAPKTAARGSDVMSETSTIDRELAELDGTISDSDSLVYQLKGSKPDDLIDRHRRFKLLLDRQSGLGRRFNPSDLKGEALGWESQVAKGSSANGRLPLPANAGYGGRGGFV